MLELKTLPILLLAIVGCLLEIEFIRDHGWLVGILPPAFVLLGLGVIFCGVGEKTRPDQPKDVQDKIGEDEDER